MKDINIKLKINSNSYKNYVYMLYDSDKYCLPLVVADTIKELSEITNIPYWALEHSVYRGDLIDNRFKVERVDIREPEEKFNYTEYIAYCFKNNLCTNRFTSLEKFKKYVYGEL